VSKPQGFLVDETYENLGKSMQIPPFFANRREELLEKIEPLKY